MISRGCKTVWSEICTSYAFPSLYRTRRKKQIRQGAKMTRLKGNDSSKVVRGVVCWRGPILAKMWEEEEAGKH